MGRKPHLPTPGKDHALIQFLSDGVLQVTKLYILRKVGDESNFTWHGDGKEYKGKIIFIGCKVFLTLIRLFNDVCSIFCSKK
jgi:hypothetical protein